MPASLQAAVEVRLIRIVAEQNHPVHEVVEEDGGAVHVVFHNVLDFQQRVAGAAEAREKR